MTAPGQYGVNPPEAYGVVPPYGTQPPVPAGPADRVDWALELIVAVAGTLFVAVTGAVAGLLWDAAAPKLSFAAINASSSGAYRPQIGADAWFLLVTVLVGVVTAVALCLLVRRPGPGAAVALGLGGLLGAFVADRVGFVAERHMTTSGLHALGVQATGELVSLLDFRVRALGVVAGWPLTALAVLGIFLGIGALRRR
jgi:hypothetical protein